MTNIALIVVDTWRKKDFEQNRNLAPFLSSKTEEGFYLHNYHSNAAWTLPAHASLFSGKLPSEHGSTTENTYFDDDNTLVKEINERGFETVAISENGLVTPETGFAKEFESFIQPRQDLGGETWKEIWEKDSEFSGRKEKYAYFFRKSFRKLDITSLQSFLTHLIDKYSGREADYNAKKTTRALDRTVKELNKEGKQFVFTNIMSVHAPYTFDEEEKEVFLSEYSSEEIMDSSQAESLEDYFPEGFSDRKLQIREKTYKAAIKYTDKKIEECYEKAPEDTVFIVLGDHGELIGEYDKQGIKFIGHHLGTYKELIQVPCLIFSKGKELKSQISQDGLYSHIEIKEIITGILDQEIITGKEMLRSEYFGRKGFIEQFNREIPEGCEQIYKRKSFSLIDSEIKYDLTTEGEYAWPIEDLTEESPINIRTVSKLKNKAEVLYEWRME